MIITESNKCTYKHIFIVHILIFQVASPCIQICGCQSIEKCTLSIFREEIKMGAHSSSETSVITYGARGRHIQDFCKIINSSMETSNLCHFVPKNLSCLGVFSKIYEKRPLASSCQYASLFEILENLPRNFQISLKPDKNNGASQENQYTSLIISRSVLLRMRNFSDKNFRENKNTFYFQ